MHRERGVDLRLRTAVQEVRRNAVVVKGPDGELDTIPTAATVWATGVSASPVVGGWGLPTGRGGRIQVEEDLRVVGHPEIFAAGDVSIAGSSLPQLAQPAIQGGRHAGAQIRRLVTGAPTEAFHYHDKGIMATIGFSDAVAELPQPVRDHGEPLGALLHLAAQPEHRGGRPGRDPCRPSVTLAATVGCTGRVS
jgi:NADH dehydrogenase